MTEYRPLPRDPQARKSLLEKAAGQFDLSNIGDLSRALDQDKLVEEAEKAPRPPTSKQETENKEVSETSEPVQPGLDMLKAFQKTGGQDERTVSQNALQEIDRNALKAANFIVPDGPVTGLSEEFRIVKRQLLTHVSSNIARGGGVIDNKAQRILICSAQSGEGKTFCAINLALSIAAEQDYHVLLIDADFAKPGASRIFGLEDRPGLMDAISDHGKSITDYIVPTDIPGFSVLPAGTRTNRDTEYIASNYTGTVLDQLAAEDPRRVMIFDSPPALAASPASELAAHVGQALMIVRADKTSETALRDALSLVSRCEKIQLLLNGVKFSATGRSFGSYYGYGEE